MSNLHRDSIPGARPVGLATRPAVASEQRPVALPLGMPPLPADLCDNCPNFSRSLIPVDLYGADPECPTVTFATRIHCCLSCATSIAVDKLGELGSEEAVRWEVRVL